MASNRHSKAPAEGTQHLLNPPGWHTFDRAPVLLQHQYDEGAKWAAFITPGRKPGQPAGQVRLLCKRCDGEFSAANR